jgi:hypothetical protein
MDSSLTFRLPRGFLEGFKEVIYMHDIRFLETICNDLHIPYREAKMKILGPGTDVQLQVALNAVNEGTQCNFWILNQKTSMYSQCSSRQLPGKTGCDSHNCYDKIKSKNFIKTEEIRNIQQLEWLYHRKGKYYLLLNPQTRQIYSVSGELQQLRLWKAPNGGKNYLIEKNLT